MTDLASMTDADLAESMRVIRPLASSGDAEARGALADREAELQRREKPVPPPIPPDYGTEQPLGVRMARRAEQLGGRVDLIENGGQLGQDLSLARYSKRKRNNI